MSKTVSKRVKKHVKPKTLPAGDDLLSVTPEPQDSVPLPQATSGENIAVATNDLPVAGETEESLPSSAEAGIVPPPAPQEEIDRKASPDTVAAAKNAMENTVDAEQAPLDDISAAGALLKAAREAAGLSIDEISRALKLAPRQVRALEQQDFAALPARTFVRGFIRNYARLLNIDAEAVLSALPPEGPQTISPAASSVKMSTRAMPILPSGNEKAIRPQTWKWLLAVAILALVAGSLFFWPQLAALFPEHDTAQTAYHAATPAIVEEVMPPMQQDHDGGSIITPIIAPLPETSAEPVVASETSTPASAAETAEPAAVAAENKEVELTLRFTADSWTEVRDGHSKVLYSALAKSGSEKTLHGEPPFSLVFGNSDGVTITLRGETVDLGDRRKQGVKRLTLE